MMTDGIACRSMLNLFEVFGLRGAGVDSPLVYQAAAENWSQFAANSISGNGFRTIVHAFCV